MLIGVFLILLILYFGRILFIPLFFGGFISFILYPICSWLEAHHLGRSFAIFIGLLIVSIPICGILFLLTQQIVHITSHWEFISSKLFSLIEKLLPRQLELNMDEKEEWLKLIIMKTSNGIYSSFKASIIFFLNILLIPFYAALILYYRERLVYFLYQFFPVAEAKKVRNIIHETIHTYYNFIKGMAFVYLLVGLLNSLGLFLLGIPNPLAFGFTASILTFIPYIGIIIGSVLPITIAWITYDNIYYPLGVIIIFTLVQFIEANFIFPLAISQRIKVNTLITLITIFAGALIWGVAGMILFIPFIAILKLISDRVDSLHPLAVLLERGKLKNNTKS